MPDSVFETKQFKLTHVEKTERKIGRAYDVAIEGRYAYFSLLENIWNKNKVDLSNNGSVAEFLKIASRELLSETHNNDFNIFDYIRKKKDLSEHEKMVLSQINDFLRRKEYEEHLKRFKDVSKGQEPALIYVSNSEYVDLFELLNNSEYQVENGVMHGGVFGTSVNVRKHKHLNGVSETDFAEVFYMLEHLSHSGNLEKLPYILFVGRCDEQTKDKGEDNFKNVVELIKARKENFIDLAVRAGNHVANDILYYREKGIPLLSVVYYADERRFYVITEHGSVEFTEYIKNTGIASEVSNRYLNALEEHLNDTAYSNIVLFRRFSQSFHCVDSREQEITKFYSVARVMGGIPSNSDIEERLPRHNYSKRTDIYLHTNCGYLNVAQRVHYLLSEIVKKLRERNDLPAKTIINAFADIVDGKNVTLNEKYADALKLSAESKKLFKAVFNEDNLNMQNILKHMFERDVLRKRKIVIGDETADQLYMPAVEQIEKSLEEWGYKDEVGKAFFSYLVLEEVGREQAQRIKENTGGKLNVVIMIHDLKTGRIFDIPERQRKWFVENKTRREAFTGAAISLEEAGVI
ncbi:MAG: hypothetical protein ACPL06_00095 [Candidatus Anstonellales archaeon]